MYVKLPYENLNFRVCIVDQVEFGWRDLIGWRIGTSWLTGLKTLFNSNLYKFGQFCCLVVFSLWGIPIWNIFSIGACNIFLAKWPKFSRIF